MNAFINSEVVNTLIEYWQGGGPGNHEMWETCRRLSNIFDRNLSIATIKKIHEHPQKHISYIKKRLLELTTKDPVARELARVLTISNLQKTTSTSAPIEQEKTVMYDAAVSFAGEDRAIVQTIVKGLQKSGLNIFYDNDKLPQLLGKDIYIYLTDLYLRKSKYCLVFISKYYLKKRWTIVEQRAILAKAYEGGYERIFPLRLDDTEVPGFLPTQGYIDIREYPIDKIIEILSEAIH